MRDNRDRWQFYKHPSKPPLSPAETLYWKESMRKTLKVGVELEYNLPMQKGTCKGDDVQCACSRIDDGCWEQCLNRDACRQMPSMDTCQNRLSKCKPSMCKDCDNYKFACIGMTCVDFVSACFKCDQFAKDCETCNRRYDPLKDPAKIRDALMKEFQPTQNYGIINKSGVVSVTTDGSLAGDKGVEIITVGRRVDYWEFYTMIKRIIDRVAQCGGYLNDRTGTHMHVLTSYYEKGSANELEKPIPQIILANFHQLCRRYQNALTWMTIAMEDPNHMTRWEKFRVSILKHSAVTKDMQRVSEDISRTCLDNGGREKYGFVNYCLTRFDSAGDISRFHVEFRQADSTLCPTYYAAIACLHYALVIKAVEISRYGLLKVGDEEWLKKALKMKEIILNGCGDYGEVRVGNTEKLLDNRQYFIKESLDMVNQLKGTLIRLGPSYEVLVKLAERPVAMRRIDGDKWEDIEKSLSVPMKSVDQLELKLSEIIDLRLIDECKDAEEWISEVQRCIMESNDLEREVSRAEIESFIDGKVKEGEMIWSDSTGSMLSI